MPNHQFEIVFSNFILPLMQTLWRVAADFVLKVLLVNFIKWSRVFLIIKGIKEVGGVRHGKGKRRGCSSQLLLPLGVLLRGMSNHPTKMIELESLVCFLSGRMPWGAHPSSTQFFPHSHPLPKVHTQLAESIQTAKLLFLCHSFV